MTSPILPRRTPFRKNNMYKKRHASTRPLSPRTLPLRPTPLGLPQDRTITLSLTEKQGPITDGTKRDLTPEPEPEHKHTYAIILISLISMILLPLFALLAFALLFLFRHA